MLIFLFNLWAWAFLPDHLGFATLLPFVAALPASLYLEYPRSHPFAMLSPLPRIFLYLPFTIQIPIQCHLLPETLPVSLSPVPIPHSPHPVFSLPHAWQSLKVFYFILLFVHIPHFRMSSLWEQGFVFFTIMSPQHLEQSWCHRMCPWVPAVDCTVPGASLLLFPLNAASSSWTDCHTVSTGLNSLSPILKKVYFSQFLYLEWVIYSCGPSCFTVDIHEHGLSILWSWYQLT